MLHTVKSVKYLDGYRLLVVFDENDEKVIDFESKLKNAKNMSFPLKDISFFKEVRVDDTTIVWPNGYDFCPDVLYMMAENEQIKKKTSNS
jgi:hypothetical protein